jgi:Transposase DDE domain
MSHQDFQVSAERLNAEYLRLALQWLFVGVGWSVIGFRADCTWTPQLLSSTALLWAWSNEWTLVERFHTARKIALFLFPRPHAPAGSYQAFIKILRKWTGVLVVAIRTALRRRMEQTLAGCWRIGGFVMFAVDGSRVDLPRTVSHEKAYAASRKRPKKKGKKSRKGRRSSRATGHSRKADSPQMWLTTMWHVGTGLPWEWRTGPSDSSERAHLLEMLAGLPAAVLIAADAGFVGYEYARAILDSRRQLLVRVGSNVKLLRKLGYARESAGTVSLWPDYAARKRQPPLVLRLVVAHNGRHPIYLVTSLLSKTTCSDHQILELYARRWGIELFYRTFKQTFGRRKLRSTTPDNAEVEMQWSLLGLWAMSLYALVQATKRGVEPRRLSAAQLLLAFRRMLRDYRHPAERGHSLCDLLGAAVIDPYIRQNKTSRNYPRKKRESPPGKPQIVTATNSQRLRATMLRHKV